MRVAADNRVQRALGVVLGVDPERLPSRLDRQALKTAFRRQAHLMHPDKALAVGVPEHALAQRFCELKIAYDYLLTLIEAQRNAPQPSEEPSPTAADAYSRFPPAAAIPRRRLRFAQYLYYARVIDWNTLFRAMRWQHRTRPCVGEIAREFGLLSAPDVSYVLRHKRRDERFGQAALRLGRLDHVRLLTILGHQHRLDRPIGRYFVEQNILTPGGLEHWLKRHWCHNLSVATAAMRVRTWQGYRPGSAARPVPVR